MLDARGSDLEGHQSQSIADMERYAENTAASLLYLTLECAGVRDLQADHAASHVGKALGMVTLLRGIAHHAAQQHCVLPSGLMREKELPQAVLFRGPKTDKEAHDLAECVFQVARTARAHLDAAQGMLDKVPPVAFRALLPAVRAAWYLDTLEKAKFNAYDPQVLQPSSHFGFQLRLVKATMLGKF